MNHTIHLSNHQSHLPIHRDEIEQVAAAVLQTENVARAEIVIALVDDSMIHEVNRTHLQHDYPTDVISFVYDSDLDPKFNQQQQEPDNIDRRGAGRILDGELVVSVETAIREAAGNGWNPLDELRLYLVHGLLHVCGYDDQSAAERTIMRKREQDILKIWNLTPHYE